MNRNTLTGNVRHQVLSFIAITFLSTAVYAQKEVSKPKLIDPANMDPTIKAGDDFMGYAGGVWLKNNPVPAKETRWGAFNMLRDFNVKAVRVILADAAADKSAAPGSVKKRVGDFYAAGMDSLAIEKAGFKPGVDVFIAMDAASSEFYDSKTKNKVVSLWIW